MDALEAMKTELAMMREEKLCMEARLISAESAVAEKKRVLSEYKAMKNLADDFLGVIIGAGADNVDENNSQNIDEETMKVLIVNAMKNFTEAQNADQSLGSRPADGENGGGYEGCSGDITNLNLDRGTNINIVKETGGGNKGGNNGDRAE